MNTQKEEVGDQWKNWEEWAREEPATGSGRWEVNRKKRPHFGDIFLNIFLKCKGIHRITFAVGNLRGLSSVEDQK